MEKPNTDRGMFYATGGLKRYFFGALKSLTDEEYSSYLSKIHESKEYNMSSNKLNLFAFLSISTVTLLLAVILEKFVFKIGIDVIAVVVYSLIAIGCVAIIIGVFGSHVMNRQLDEKKSDGEPDDFQCQALYDVIEESKINKVMRIETF